MEQVEEGKSRKKSGIGFRLTERDFDLLAFLFDQKFASLPILYFRFFDRRASVLEPVPVNYWVTRQRVTVLRQAGLITSQKVFTDSKALYLLTLRGYELLKYNRGLDLYKEPIKAIDFRYFEHDKRATLCRVALERQDMCRRWFSDRYLRNKKGYPLVSGKFFELPDSIVPDGIFLSSKNELIALEVEHTPKKRERYEFKRRQFEKLFAKYDSVHSPIEPALHRVIFVASTDRIGKDLMEFFGAHQRFQVLNFENFIGGYLGKEALL